MELNARIYNHFNSKLFRNAYYFMINAIATSGLGFVFWKLVATRYSSVEIGTASGYLSTVGLISSVGNLGLGFGIIQFLSKTSTGSFKNKLINSSYTLTATASLSIAFAYLLMADKLTPVMASVNDSIMSIMFLSLFLLYGPGTD